MYSAEKQSESWSVTRKQEGCQSPRKVEKVSKQKSQQSGLQFSSCSCDFLRMLICVCSPRREQTCALPVPGKVIVGPPHLLPRSSSGVSCCPHGTGSGCKGRTSSLPCGQGEEDWAFLLNLVFTWPNTLSVPFQHFL